MSDFFTDRSGTAPNFLSTRRRSLGAMLDPAIDLMLAAQNIRLIDRAMIPRRVLAVGIEVPGRSNDIHDVLNRLQQSSRHAMTISIVRMQEGLGKFANIERALANVSLYDHDWLVVTDDDIAFSSHMLDRLITLSEMADLSIAQPAHTLSSFATYTLTLRQPGSFVRQTHFVEIGPLTLFSRKVFPDVIPFPPSRWCYGIDLVWSELARTKGFQMGIVDAAPVRHLRGVANSYNIIKARAEGEELTRNLRIPFTRAELLKFEKRFPAVDLKRLARQRTRGRPAEILHT